MFDIQPEKLSGLLNLTGKLKQAMFEVGKLRPELLRIWGLMKLRKTGYRIKANDGIKLLIFRNQESAIAWDIMSSYGISIADYTALYYAQWDRDPTMIHHPEEVRTTYPVDKDFPKRYEKTYKLNDFEVGVGWCPLCRGTGFMSLLRFDAELIVNGIPSPLVKDICVHDIVKNKREVLG